MDVRRWRSNYRYHVCVLCKYSVSIRSQSFPSRAPAAKETRYGTDAGCNVKHICLSVSMTDITSANRLRGRPRCHDSCIASWLFVILSKRCGGASSRLQTSSRSQLEDRGAIDSPGPFPIILTSAWQVTDTVLCCFLPPQRTFSVDPRRYGQLKTREQLGPPLTQARLTLSVDVLATCNSACLLFPFTLHREYVRSNKC